MSGSNNAFGGSDFNQIINTVQPGNFADLEQALSTAGVADDDLAALRAAIDEDGGVPGGQPLGAGVSGWLREIGGKLASASATAVTTAVMAYAGLSIGG